VNQEQYTFQTNESYLDFEFESDGPNGQIKKVVRYSPRNANGMTYFNLGFGDWNGAEGRIDDSSVSNNHDTQKILATVAATVLEFTAVYPDMPVYARGSTPSRTRLYQMGISANLAQIEPFTEIYALKKDGIWEPFQTGINYEAFMAWRKSND
jgi:hypothetical protein